MWGKFQETSAHELIGTDGMDPQHEQQIWVILTITINVTFTEHERVWVSLLRSSTAG